MISVILPFYNADKTLARAINSVLDQVMLPTEIILVNNNSTDLSLEIAKDFERNDNLVILIHEAKQGVVSAMNLGLQNAKGKWIARMDADDYWYKNKLKEQFVFAINNPDIQVIGTQVAFISSLIQADGFRNYVAWSNKICTHQEIQKAIFTESPLVNPSIMFRKSLIEQYGLYRQGDFPEDYEMFLRWHSVGVKMAKLPIVLMDWHDSNKRLTRTNDAYSEWAFNSVKCHYLSVYLKSTKFKNKKIWIWGAGRKAKQKVKDLEMKGIDIVGFIDLASNTKLTKPCISYKELIFNQSLMLISFVSNRGKGEEIREFLIELGYTEGLNFIIAA